jgi:hypothetical protein
MSVFDWDDPEFVWNTMERTRSLCPQFIGLDESEALALASQLKLELRIIGVDRTPSTMDGRPSRVTVDLRSGRVTKAEAG